MIDKINRWNWPDTIGVPEGYDIKHIPDNTRRNLQYLADKVNELIEAVNKLTNENEVK